jgi:hypothetical protein
MQYFRIFVIMAGLHYGAGCATGPQIDEHITSDTARGSVYLERIPDRQFQAAHPIKLDRGLIERALRGVMVRQQRDVLQSLVVGQAQVIPAFSDEDIMFLSPAIADGLARAAPDQQVGFRLLQIGAPVYSQRTGAAVGSSEPLLSLSPREFTSGSVYAYGRSLYLALSEYRNRPERPDTVKMPNRHVPDETGLVNRDLLFTPEIAWRSDLSPPVITRDGLAKVVAIDLQRLAQAPAPRPLAAPPSEPTAPLQPGGQARDANPPAAPASELQTLKEEMKRKDSEMEDLRKELEAIRRRLDQAAEQAGKTAVPPPKKPLK